MPLSDTLLSWVWNVILLSAVSLLSADLCDGRCERRIDLPLVILEGCLIDNLLLKLSQTYSLIIHLRSLPTQDPLSPLLSFLNIHVAADLPVAKSECLSHGIPNIRPADDSDRDANDCIEYGHYLTNWCLGSNVTIAYGREMLYTIDTYHHLPIVVMTVME